MDEFLRKTSEEGVAVVQAGGDQGIYEDFGGMLGEGRTESGDIAEGKKGCT